VTLIVFNSCAVLNSMAGQRQDRPSEFPELVRRRCTNADFQNSLRSVNLTLGLTGISLMEKSSIKAGYEVAKLVYHGSMSPGEGAKQLKAVNGFNINSARDLIMVFRQLMKGESFQRGLSAPDMDFFLSHIGAEFGPVTLRAAVQGLWLHIRYYEGIRKVKLHKLRGVAAGHQARAAVLENFSELEAKFGEAVQRSLTETSDKRRERLKAVPKVPTRVPVVLFAFERNPDVVAEILLKAKGKCERCKKSAPFLRCKDNSPYLEVHHVVLCPNCHRELHYGVTGRTSSLLNEPTRSADLQKGGD
jgi:5-methylcytosine-specific restriction protein A